MGDVASPGIVTSQEKLSSYGMSFEWGVEASTQIYAGELVGLMPDGYLAPADTSGCLCAVGRAEQTVLGTSVAGAVTCRFLQGIFRWSPSGSNAPTIANRKQLCYVSDDQTVTMAPGIPAGIVEGVDSQGVWVLTELGQAGGAPNKIYLPLYMSDIVSADAKVYHTAAPIGGFVTNIIATVQAAALTGGNATLTGKLGSTAITGGVVTITQAGSAVGQVFSAQPTAANQVAQGGDINFTVGGTQTATGAQLNVLIEITPA